MSSTLVKLCILAVPSCENIIKSQRTLMNRRYSSAPSRGYGKPKKSFSGGGSRSRRPGGRNQGTTDPRKFINKGVSVAETSPHPVTHSFSDFGFHEDLQKNLVAKGYTTPTPIQDQAIKPLMEGLDLIGLANTGTGKTAAFLLPIIHSQLQQKSRNAALIIAPTRELAHQVDDEFRAFSKGLNLFSVVCVGGENIQRQKSELRRGVNVVIGTPGRLKDLLKQGELKVGKTQTLVLDEADQMLDMGFLPDMRFIMQGLPEDKQVVCFSATMTSSVSSLLQGIQDQAVTISTTQKVTSEHIDQNIIVANTKEEKIDYLLDLLNTPEYQKILVFGETKHGVQRLADSLAKFGHHTEAIHGNKSQSQRQRALRNFKEAKASVLVATDVAARGLDIPNVHLVVNFDQPQTHDTYIHRIGRTGRAGQTGTARTFVNSKQASRQ